MIQLHLDEALGGKKKSRWCFSESFQNICPTIQYISIHVQIERGHRETMIERQLFRIQMTQDNGVVSRDMLLVYFTNDLKELAVERKVQMKQLPEVVRYYHLIPRRV